MSAPATLDPAPDVAAPAARPPSGEPRRPLDIVTAALGGHGALAERALLALTADGWALVHPSRPKAHVMHFPVPESSGEPQ